MGNLVSLVLWPVNGIVNENNVKPRKTRRRRRNKGKKGNLISSSSSMENAKDNLPPATIDGEVDNQQKDAVDQPHVKIVKVKTLTVVTKYFQPLRIIKNGRLYKYPTMTKVLGDFKFAVIGAQFISSEVIVMHSKYNNTGKSTFLRLLAGLLKPDTIEANMNMPRFNVSYMPQKINLVTVSTSTVRHLLQQRITRAYNDPYFVSNVMQLLHIEQLLDQQVVNLSLGECQRVELCLCLGKPADIYLIDEPTAYLDPELGMAAVKAIKGFILHANKTAFVVEPDLKKANYLANRVITFVGKPKIHCCADAPQYFFLNLYDEEWLREFWIPEGTIMRPAI